MQSFRKAERVRSLLVRLDGIGGRLMNQAISCYGDPIYFDLLGRVLAVSERSMKLADYYDWLTSPEPRRISA